MACFVSSDKLSHPTLPMVADCSWREDVMPREVGIDEHGS